MRLLSVMVSLGPGMSVSGSQARITKTSATKTTSLATVEDAKQKDVKVLQTEL